jgi:hypothetical protein
MPVDEQLTKAELCATEGDNTDPIVVYFNPKELQIDKQVPWKKHEKTEGDSPSLEFTAAEPKMLTVELMFDGFESQTDVYSEYVTKLENLCKVIESKKRPPNCTFTYGSSIPVFTGVVESLGVKYTMFGPDGTPWRCTVNIKMKQADKVMNKDEAKEASKAKAKQTKGVQTDASTAKRTDNVAAANNTTPKEVWKQNNVDDPNNIKPGTNLTTNPGAKGS